MAKKLTADHDTGKGTSAGHNVANINHAIRSTLDEVLKIEGQIDAAHEKHVAPLKKLKRDKLRELKRHEIPTKVAQLYLAQLRMVEEARDFDDDSDKAKTIDAMALVFEAVYGGTTEGETVNFIDVLDRLSIPPGEGKPANGKGGADVNSAPAGNA